MVTNCFGVFPDGDSAPSAVFSDLEDAMEWGLRRYGSDAFGIRFFEIAQVPSEGRTGSPSPAQPV